MSNISASSIPCPRRLCRGGRMSRKMLCALAVVALPVATLPLSGQERGRGRGGPVNLPDGAGKEIVQSKCEACHGLNLITTSGYSRDEWASLFTTMVALPQNEVGTV